MRWRAIGAALSKELFGKVLAIPHFPRRPDLKGLGLSDDRCYSMGLAKKLGYVNTFHDREPKFDIMRVGVEHVGRYDFLISSDVFEHVPPPPLVAFANARRMLRTGGILVFSVPYRVEGETIEHFPELFEYELSRGGTERILRNRTKDGRLQEFRDLVFHGGSGFTLEMRVFSLKGIRESVEQAGFSRLTIYDQDAAEFGIRWQGAAGSHAMVARA
jgi:SAM-dependent methyltransferase